MGNGHLGPTNALLAQSYVGWMEISWLASIHSTSVRVCSRKPLTVFEKLFARTQDCIFLG